MGFLFCLALLLLPVLVLVGLYLLVTKTNVITGGLASLLRKLLRRIGVCRQGDNCFVEPCPGGFILRNVNVPPKLLELNGGSITVPSVTVKRVQLSWPTSSSPLALSVSGVSIKLLQRRTAPKVKLGGTTSQSKHRKLRALDALLWHGQQSGNAAGWLSQKRQQALRWLLSLALRNIRVDLTDLSVQYVQTGEPAPVVSDTGDVALDAVAVSVRSLTVSSVALTPTGTVASEDSPCSSATRTSGQDAVNGTSAISSRWALVAWGLRRLQRRGGCGQELQIHHASRVAVTGVNVILMSRAPRALQPSSQAPKAQQWHSQQRHGNRRLPQRARASAVAADRGTTGVKRIVTGPALAGCDPPLPHPEAEWDSVHTVLRQWSVEVEVSLNGPRERGNCVGGSGYLGRRTYQPLAVQVHGTFGVRSGRGRQQAAAGIMSPGKRQGDSPSNGGASSGGASPCGPSRAASMQAGDHLSRRQGQRLQSDGGLPTQDQQAAPAAAAHAAAATGQPGGRGSSAGAPFSLHVNVALKALLPELTPAATVQLIRMAERFSTYEKYCKYWMKRPSVSVTESPAAWWQHAGRAIINDCREHYPSRKLSDFMARRADYIRTYKALRSIQQGFLHRTLMPYYKSGRLPRQQPVPVSGARAQEPGTESPAAAAAAMASPAGAEAAEPGASGTSRAGWRWFRSGDAYSEATSGTGTTAMPDDTTAAEEPHLQTVTYKRYRGPKSAAQLGAELSRLEAQLTLGQIMCYRTFVALWHSEYLARTPGVKERWEAALSVITNFVDALPTTEEVDEDEGLDATNADSRPAGDGNSYTASRSSPSAFNLRIVCPRLGLKLVNKHEVVPAASVKPGAGPSATGEQLTPQDAKRSVDVLLVVLEGIRFSMPSVHHMALEAATVRASLLGSSFTTPKHVLVVPASRESMELHGTKLDFSGSAAPRGLANSQSVSMTKPMASTGSVYSDAPISAYLSRFKVNLAPVEVALTHPACIVASAEFLASMVRLRAATANTHARRSSTSLHSLVMDSYTRNRVPLPSSMAAFMPKLQICCPMVTARGLLLPDFTPSVGGVSGRHSDALAVAVFTDICLSSRYVKTCYTALLLSASGQAHAELYYQLLPRSGVQGRAPSASSCSSAPVGASEAPSKGMISPQQGPFGMVWLHPDDVNIAFPQRVNGPLQACTAPGIMGRRSSARLSQDPKQFGASGTLRVVGSITSGSAPADRVLDSYPFIPVLKIRSLCALAMSQVPYEPAVPGTMTTHQTVGVHSIMAWFSPWQAKLLASTIDQIKAHPVLAILRDTSPRRQVPSAGVTPQAAGSATGGAEAASSLEEQQAADAAAATKSSGGSSISLMLDVHLLTVNCYVELPAQFRHPEDLRTRMEAMQQSGAQLQVPFWVTTSSKSWCGPGDWPTMACADPVVRWGLSLTPLLTGSITNVRAGLRLSRNGQLQAAVQTTGCQVSDHQARFKGQLYDQVWRANAGRASCGPAARGTAFPQDLLPDGDGFQLLGPLATRADAMRTFARDRRRAAFNLSIQLVPSRAERRGQAQQLWRRLIEVRQLHRASDFAMFLLSTAHSTAERLLINARLRPFDCYQALRKSQADEDAASAFAQRAARSSVAGNDTGPFPSVFNAVFGQDSKLGGRLGSTAPLLQRRTSMHGRSRSGFAALATSASRFGLQASHHRKAASMVQALSSVTNANLLSIMALRRSTVAATAPKGGGSTSGGPATLRQEFTSMSRLSMSRIPEDSLVPPSSLEAVASERSDFTRQASGAVSAIPGGPSFRNSVTLRRTSSNNIERTASQEVGFCPDADTASVVNPPGMPSVFSTAGAESQAAAVAGAPAAGSGLGGSPWPKRLPLVLVDDALTKLSFVQAYRHFGRILVGSHEVAGVDGMPQPDPWVSVMAVQAPKHPDYAPLRQARVSCQHVAMCAGVHSLGAVINMMLQAKQALSSPSASSASARVTRDAPSKPARLEAQLCISSVQLKVVMEEKPRRLHPRPGPLKPGLTELTAVHLHEISAVVKPASDPLPVAHGGLTVDVGISDVQVQDLQGCIEHRNVLAANGLASEPGGDGKGSPNPSQSGESLPNQDPSRSCRVEVFCGISSTPAVPTRLVVGVHDPRLTWLRRYSNNLSYAVGAVLKAYRSAVERQGKSSSAAAATSATAPPHGHERADRAETPKSSPPVLEFKIYNLGLVLPGGAASRKQPTRHSVNNDALALSVLSLAVCLPGNVCALGGLGTHAGVSADPAADQPGEDSSLDDDLAWMTSEENIDRLIWSSLRLSDRHFPQFNEPVEQERPAPELAKPCSGHDIPARSPQAALASSPDASERGGKLAKHLQAAKANIIDPLKEILQEAQQKRNKRHGEAGLLIIDEGPAGALAREFVPGYLSIPEADHRTLTSVAAMQHTTTTITAQQPSGGQAARGGMHGVAEQQRLQPGNVQQTAQGHGVHPEGSSSPGCYTPAEPSPNRPRFRGCSRANPPLALFSAHGLAAFSCKLVPKAQASATASAEPDAPGGPSEPVPCDSPAVNAGDCPVGSNGDLLANPSLDDVHRLIDPALLTGVVFHHTRHAGLQLHFSVPEPMVATLGPTRYRRMISVLTDNVVEARSCFEAGAEFNSSNTNRKTSFSQGMSFGPRPGQVPSFHLSVDWQKQLYAALESDPSWWRPGMQPGMHPVEPCLEGCFTRCSLGLVLECNPNDMHLAFHSQQLHIADVRVSPLVQAAEGGPRYASSEATGTVNSYGWGGTYDTYSGTSHDDRDGGLYEEEDEASEGGLNMRGMYGDNESMEMPEGVDVQPVVDAMQETFPGRQAVVTLIRSNIDLPASEAAHLAAAAPAPHDRAMAVEGGECPPDDEHNCVRISFAMLHDGTMANEIELCHTLAQWPYLTEMSLVSSIISIFLPNWGRPAAGPEAALRLAATPWFYFNLVLRESQLYVPVLAPHLRILKYGWRASDGMDVSLSAEKLQELFASMAAASPSVDRGMAMAAGPPQRQGSVGLGLGPIPERQRQAGQRLGSVPRGPRMMQRGSGAVASPLDQPVLSSNWTSLSMRRLTELAGDEEPLRLEEMGVVLTVSALRVGHFSGGDGESILKIDLRNAAGFVRHSTAQVTNWLLPIKSMAMEYRSAVPLVEESKLLQKYIKVARLMIFQLRTRIKASRGRRSSVSAARPDQARPGQEQHQQPSERPHQSLGRTTTGGVWGSCDAPGQVAAVIGPGGEDMSSVRSRNMRSVDSTKLALELLVEQATARASGLLEQHKLSLPTSSTTQVTLENLLSRHAAVSTITFELDTAVVRGSFSNIPVWHALMDDMGLALGLIQANKGLFAPAPGLLQATRMPAVAKAPPGLRTGVPASQAEAVAYSKATWNFRPSTMYVDVHVKSLAFVLCDDKPKSYGAPDVLTAAMERLALQYATEKRFCDHAPEQSGCLSLLLSAQFLNNSTGRWEHLLEPWPAELHLSDPINPVFKSSRTKYVFASSSELLKLNFHPSCLLTLGDTLAFVRRLSMRREEAAADNARGRSDVATPDAEKPPSSREQMALTGSIMSRVPQRYLIQNMTGIMMSYWAPSAGDHAHALPSAVANKKLLPPGCSEELQVTPTAKEVKIVGPGGVVITRLQAQVIVLKFEGSWMPIPDVCVDVVGKYCYDLHSPHDDRRAPVVVDVVLVGRTKILKIHSALYIQNSTRLRMGFRLHLPSALLTRQIVLGHGDTRLPGEQDIRLRPLRPGEGRYLPVLAALDGTLYLEPRSTTKPPCVYMPAEHDVIHLSPTVSKMPGQSGFIACGPPMDGQKGLHGKSPLHFAVKVKAKSRAEYSYTTFHTIEVHGPGEFGKASRPLEASIKVTPTAQVTNSLPYHMEGYFITVSGPGKEPEMGSSSLDTESNRVAGAPDNPQSGGAANSSGAMSPTLASDLHRRLGRFRRMEAATAGSSGEERQRVLLDMIELVALLKPKERVPDMGTFTANEVKCCLLALLRFELRWAAKRGAKEMELLIRTDSEPADKISWHDLSAFIEWAKHNVRRVNVQPGTTQDFHVDMHKQGILCIKVPELKLISSRPVEVSYGVGTTSSHEAEQLPELMRLIRNDGVESFNDVMRGMQLRNRMEVQKPLLQVVNQHVRDTAGAIGKIGTTVRGALETLGGPTPLKGAPGSPRAEGPAAESAAFWSSHPETLVRVELTVEPGPWPGSGGGASPHGLEAAPGIVPTEVLAVAPGPTSTTAGAGPLAEADELPDSAATAADGMDTAPPGSPAYVAIVMSPSGTSSVRGSSAARTTVGGAVQQVATDESTAAVAAKEARTPSTGLLGMLGALARPTANAPSSGRHSAFASAVDVAAAAACGDMVAPSPAAGATAPLCTEEVQPDAAAQHQSDRAAAARSLFSKKPILRLLGLAGIGKAKEAKTTTAAVLASGALERTDLPVDEDLGQPVHVAAAAANAETARLLPVEPPVVSQEPDLTPPPQPAAEEQHVRIRFHYRPSAVPAAPAFVYRITKRIQTIFDRMVPGVMRDGPDGADRVHSASSMRRGGSIIFPRARRTDSVALSSQRALHVRLQVLPATENAPERVQLQLVAAGAVSQLSRLVRSPDGRPSSRAMAVSRRRITMGPSALPRAFLRSSLPTTTGLGLGGARPHAGGHAGDLTASGGSSATAGLQGCRSSSGQGHQQQGPSWSADGALPSEPRRSPAHRRRANPVEGPFSSGHSLSMQEGSVGSPSCGVAGGHMAAAMASPFRPPTVGRYRVPAVTTTASSPSVRTPLPSHTSGAMQQQEPDSAVSTDALHTILSSEATPGTVVVLRSGSNSSISMPSMSPPLGSAAPARGPAGENGSGQEPSAGSVAVGTGGDSNVCSPLAREASIGRGYTVWSDNPAYLRHSGMSTGSVLELPTRRQPSDFQRQEEEASSAAAGRRLDSTPECTPSVKGDKLRDAAYGSMSIAGVSTRRVAGVAFAASTEGTGVLSHSSGDDGRPAPRTSDRELASEAAAASSFSHGASGSYRFVQGHASSEGSELSSRVSGVTASDGASHPSQILTVGASSASRSHLSGGSNGALMRPPLLPGQQSATGASLASFSGRPLAVRRRSLGQPASHSVRIIPAKSAHSASSSYGSGSGPSAGRIERRITWQAGSFGDHLAAAVGSNAGDGAATAGPNNEHGNGGARRRRRTAHSFTRSSERALPAIREALTPMTSADASAAMQTPSASVTASPAVCGRRRSRVQVRRRTADDVLAETPLRLRNGRVPDLMTAPSGGAASMAAAEPHQSGLASNGTRLPRRISEQLAAARSLVQLKQLQSAYAEHVALQPTQHLSLKQQLEEMTRGHGIDTHGRLLRQSSLGRGRRQGSMQPSYKQLGPRDGSSRRLVANPLELAKSAMQAVPRLPSIARNMGERIVDGGHHVLQGGTDVVTKVSGAIVLGGQQVATRVADTLIAGGQEVREIVVEGTELVIAAAKPKIKHSLKTVAWQVTEAMRKRKQGDKPELVKDAENKSPDATKKKKMDLAPKVLLLNLHNSLATKEEDHVCRLSLYAPFWVDNRSGFDLIFKDMDAPAVIDKLPFLLWHPVGAPGVKTDAVSLDSPIEAAGFQPYASTPRLQSHGTGRRKAPLSHPHKASLLNEQSRTRFRVGDERYSKTDFCAAFTVSTTSQKYSVDIKAEKHEVLLEDMEAMLSRGATGFASPSGGDGRRGSHLDRLITGIDSPRTLVDPPRFRKSPSAPRVGEPERPTQLLPLPGLPPAHMQHDLAPNTTTPASQPAASKRQLRVELPEAGQGQGVGLSALQGVPGQPQAAEQPAEAVVVQLAAQEPLGVVPSGSAVCPDDATLQPAKPADEDLAALPACTEPALERPLIVPPLPLAQHADTGAGDWVSAPEITPVKEEAVVGAGPFQLRSHFPLPSLADIPEHPSPDAASAAVAPLSPAMSARTAISIPTCGADRVSSIGTPCLTPVAAAAPRAGRFNINDMSTADDGDVQRNTRNTRSGEGGSARGSGGAHKAGVSSNPAYTLLSQVCERQPKTVAIRRMYQFAVEVWPAPNSTVFRRTKIITIKNKYLILNATGLTIEYKQKGTPDPFDMAGRQEYGKGRRFSGVLAHNWRAAWHWDNAYAEQELMIRPAGDDWEWSGSFKLPENEDYFGLRIRHRHTREYVIIPVNITVGAAGSVLVTLKSKESVPPYMIINRCRDVVIRLKQAEWAGRSSTGRLISSDTPWDDWDEIVPNANAPMPFAWDEPRLKHTVRVVATAQRDAAPKNANPIDVNLDAVDANTIIYVQSRAMHPHFLPLAARTDQRERMKYLSENAKKVYVTVYADGPTRVLCFSEDRTGMANMDDENSLINLSYRLQQVATRLKEIEHRLVLQLGNAQEQARGVLAPVGSVSQAAATASAVPAASPDTERHPASISHGNATGTGSVSTMLGPSSFAVGSSTARRPAGSAWSVVRGALLGSTGGVMTPPSLRQGLPASLTGLGGANIQRNASISRNASTGTCAPAHGASRMQSLQSALPGRPHHTRSMSGQGHGVNQTPSLPPGPAVSGLPQLLAAAPVGAAGGTLSQLLEQLPAYGNDVDVPYGGDLAVVLRYVEGLTTEFRSNEKLLAVEAKMVVHSSDPSLKDRQDHVQATASWIQIADPYAGGGWLGGAAGSTGGGAASRVDLRAYEETFRDIPASAELQIDFSIAKGTYQTHVGGTFGSQAHAHYTAMPLQGTTSGSHAAAGMTPRPASTSTGAQVAISSGQFAGCVRVPLLLTLGREKHQEWRLPLERKSGSQRIRGYVVVSFEWSFTNEGLLIREVAALERIMAEKIELLALLNPLPATATTAFVRPPGSSGSSSPAEAAVAANGSSGSVASITEEAGGFGGEGRSLNLGAEGATTALPRALPAKRTAKAMSESYYVNLEVSVLEVTGLLPREGVRANIAASLHGRQQAGMVATAMLPRAVVSMTCAGEKRTAPAGVNSVHPRFPKNTNTFQNVPLGSKVHMQVLDQVSSSYTRLLAEAEMHVSDIPGTDPLYAWLSLPRRKRNRSQRSLALLATMEEEGEAEVQVLVRIKIHKPQVHGVLAAVTLDMAGVGLCAKTNLEELFNFTIQKVRASLVQTRTDLQVTSAVHAIQLDNQMLEAKNPVVLAPADGSQSSSVAHARRRHKARLARRAEGPNPILRLGHQDPSVQDPLITFQITYNQASSNQANDVNAYGSHDNVGILAFKKVVLELGPLDFSADQEFIEGVIAYLHAMPLADLYQNEAWQKQIDAMQGGGTAGHAEEAVHVSGQRDKPQEDALVWLLKKEASELELLRGQSSMWFYLEEFYLSDIFINVTLALSSSFNAGVGGAPSTTSAAGSESERQRTMLRGFLSRVSGNNGFQLINVTNAPIQLEYVSFQNRLYNRVSLVNTLWRHYSWIAIAQARKVLGGAGPAIAAIPASLLWASLALVDLGQDVAAKRVRPHQVPMRIGYVLFTLSGQVVGVLSRTMCAVMGVLPPRFSSDSMTLTDSEAARRFAVKPQTVMDALYLGQRDVVLGALSGAFGFVHDTAAGLRWPNGLGAVGLPVGLAKASLGVAMRPAAGTVEAFSKVLQGVGLLCLGKRGIQGKLARRVQAPGLAITDVVQAARANAVQEAYQASLIAAWQNALPNISSSLAGDEVVDVVAARPTRVVLLTSRHLAYIVAKRHSSSSSSSSTAASSGHGGGGAFTVSYRVKWIIRNDHIDNIRGLERNYAVSVEYHKPVNLGRMSLKLPLRKGMRTSTAEGHKNLIFRLNRHIGHATSGASRDFGSLAAAASGGGAASAGVDVQELRITMPHAGHASSAGVGGGVAGSQGVPLGMVSSGSLGGGAGACVDSAPGSAEALHMAATSRPGRTQATNSS